MKLKLTPEEIKDFCKVCDHYQENKVKPCKDLSYDFQMRYLSQNWCCWGKVQGKLAKIITKYNVVIGKKIYPRDKETGLIQKIDQ